MPKRSYDPFAIVLYVTFLSAEAFRTYNSHVRFRSLIIVQLYTKLAVVNRFKARVKSHLCSCSWMSTLCRNKHDFLLPLQRALGVRRTKSRSKLCSPKSSR